MSFSWPSYSEEEVEATSTVLRSGKVNYWTGEEGRLFEQEFADFCGVEYAVALANGTVALELALHSLGLGAGDEVIVTSRTFIASVSAIVAVGATPVFSDVDRSSQNITAETIAVAITEKTQAIITVHLAGWPCDMDSIMKLAKQHNLYVVEDCAQAHGATYKGKQVGSIGDVGCWSFCQDKIMTTGGEGGMVTTNNRDLWSKIWSHKDHGKSWDAIHAKGQPTGFAFKWLHESFGTNGRMTEMQAAIGRIQLSRMSEWHQARTDNANAILDVCEQFPSLFYVPRPPADVEHAFYKCYVFIEPEALRDGWSRDRILFEMAEFSIPCGSGICPEVYLEQAFIGLDVAPAKPLLVARHLGKTSLMFRVDPVLSSKHMHLTADVLINIMERACY